MIMDLDKLLMNPDIPSKFTMTALENDFINSMYNSEKYFSTQRFPDKKRNFQGERY